LSALLLIPVYTTYLAPHEYGAIALIGSIVNVLVCFLYQPFRYAFTRFYIDTFEDERKSTELISTVVFTYLLWGGLILAILILFDGDLFGWAIKEYAYIKPYLNLGYIFAFLSYGLLVLTDKLVIDHRSMAFAIANLTQFFVRIAIIIALVVFFGYRLYGVYGAMIVEGAMSMLVAIYFMRKYYRIRSFNHARLVEYGAYALPLIPHALSFSLLNVGDRIIMQNFLDLDMVGVYHIGFQIALGFHFIDKGFFRAFSPMVMKGLRRNDKQQKYKFFLKEYVNRLIPVILALGIMVNLLYLTWTQEMLQLLIRNSIYIRSLDVISIILAAMALNFLQGLFIPLLHYRKHSKEIMLTTVISVVTHLSLNILLIPVYGIVGAAFATLVAAVIRWLAVMAVVRIKQGVHIHLLPYLGPLAFMAGFYALFQLLTTTSSELGLGTTIAIKFIVSGGLLAAAYPLLTKLRRVPIWISINE